LPRQGEPIGEFRKTDEMLGAISSKSDPHGFAPRPHEIVPQERSTGLPNVQAWLIACDQDDSQSPVDVLTPAEVARSRRFARCADRAAFMGTRAALRRILARELDVEPRAIRLAEPDLGKPRLCAEHGRGEIDFSVAHTDGLAVIALARQALVGADIERCRAVPEKLKIATEMFGEDAARAIAALPPSGQENAFLRLWTAGEAYVKATGAGLALHHRRIPICIEADGAQVAFRRDFAERDAWRLAFIDAPVDYVGCLATLDRNRMRSPSR
jgi:4'-phosphopantetheinyl transferase